MKYSIKIDERTYIVEIEDINVRPVRARVDGIEFEVMPEKTGPVAVTREARKKSIYQPASTASPSPNPALSGNALTAPLPGTVTEVFVKAGEKVESGQVVLVIEAMKMKNSIRSLYSGTVSEVLVSAGQSVAHKQPLIKFADMGEAAWI
jgi:biotin carboxyl carrier protein